MKNKIKKKLKLYVLLGLFLTLAACDDSCERVLLSLFDSGRFVYAVGGTGMWGLGGATAFPVGDLQGIPLNGVYSKYKYAGVTFPMIPHSASEIPRVTTSPKPAMWAVSSAQNAVYLVDSNLDTLAGKVSVGQAPTAAVFSPDNNLLYVTNSGSDSISVIDTNAGTVSTIPLTAGSHPTGIAVTPDGASLFVINSAQNSVSEVDTAAKKVTATFAVGQGPAALAVTPDGLLLYVCNGKDNNVTVYDILTTEKVQTVTGITNPTAIAFTVDGIKAYVTSGISSGLLYSIRAKTYNLGKTPVAVGNNPVFVTLDTYNTLIYVANKGSNNLTVINSSDNSIAGTVSLGGSPLGVISLP